MKYEQLFDIARDMSNINGYGISSQILLKYIKEHIMADNEQTKRRIEKKTNTFLFNAFMNSIDRDSRKEIYNLNVSIQEDSYLVERKWPSWHISSYGAVKYKNTDGKVILYDKILRDYEHGFNITEDSSLEAKMFMSDNNSALERINNYMSRKEEIITKEYKTRKNISREFTEKLIDYIGFRRIGDIKDDINKKR